MLRPLSLLSLFFLLPFLACGGGDDKTPPPPASTPQGNQTLKDVENQFSRVSIQCTETVSSPLAAVLMASRNATTDNSSSLPLLMSLFSKSNTKECSHDLMNIILQLMSVDNGQWINQSSNKQWVILRMMALLTKIGGSAGIQSPTDFRNYLNNPVLVLALRQYIDQNFIRPLSVYPSLRPVAQTASGYLP